MSAPDVGMRTDQGQNPRSNPRKRRQWLRDLDTVLGGEIEDAGALSCLELGELGAEPLRGRGSPAIVTEWWEYAYRRGWLEQLPDGRCRLSAQGRADLAARRRSDAIVDQSALGRGVIKWILPAGTLGTAAYLSGRYPAALVEIIVIAFGVGIGLILLSPLVARWSHRIDVQNARRACDWLDDRPVFPARDRRQLARPAMRLYEADELSAPGLSTS